MSTAVYTDRDNLEHALVPATLSPKPIDEIKEREIVIVDEKLPL